jgi:hypothetical protein
MIDGLVARFKSEERWDQKAILVNLIHKAMITDNKGWRVRDSAALLGLSMGTCSEYITIAEHIDQLQDVYSHRQAMKKIKSGGI